MYSSQIWHMYATHCTASEYALYKIIQSIDCCCLATEECEITPCVQAGIKHCHRNTIHSLSGINV